jgi:hypothetical protein
MSKSRQSHDQKRKAKLAKRAARGTHYADVEPYTGRKYQTDFWVPYIFQTESAIYEAIRLSRRRLTNDEVKVALVRLISHLHAGNPPRLGEADSEVLYTAGNEIEFLVWNIRRHWGSAFDEHGAVSANDLVGILRTLLYSIQAHGWNTGRSRGYVAFLVDFMEQGGLY